MRPAASRRAVRPHRLVGQPSTGLAFCPVDPSEARATSEATPCRGQLPVRASRSRLLETENTNRLESKEDAEYRGRAQGWAWFRRGGDDLRREARREIREESDDLRAAELERVAPAVRHPIPACPASVCLLGSATQVPQPGSSMEGLGEGRTPDRCRPPGRSPILVVHPRSGPRVRPPAARPFGIRAREPEGQTAVLPDGRRRSGDSLDARPEAPGRCAAT
jgi:hypothetical protein